MSAKEFIAMAALAESGQSAALEVEAACLAILDDLRERLGREHGFQASVASVGSLKAALPEGGWGKVFDIAQVATAGSRVAAKAHGEREERGLRMALVGANLLITPSDAPGWVEVRSSPEHERRKAEVASSWANEAIERMRDARRKARKARPLADWSAQSKDSREVAAMLERHELAAAKLAEAARTPPTAGRKPTRRLLRW